MRLKTGKVKSKWMDRDPQAGIPVMVEIDSKQWKEDPEKTLEKALRKFKKKMYNANILDDFKKFQYFDKPSVIRRKKINENKLKRKWEQL